MANFATTKTKREKVFSVAVSQSRTHDQILTRNNFDVKKLL